MTKIEISNTIVRVAKANYPLIKERLAEAFPTVKLTHDPITEPGCTRVFVGYYPPEEESLSEYDWIHVPAAGVDRILDGLKGSTSTPVITRTIGRMGEQMGEYCLAYALAHFQKMETRRGLQDERNWWKKAAAPTHIFDKTIGILGTGYIGQGIARTFKALGARVIGYSRSGSMREPFDAVLSLTDFPGNNMPDVLVSALPWTADTEGLINGALFGTLKDVLFINVGRGATLDETALRSALETGQVSHAVLDVFPKEPLDPEHWFWTDSRVTVTPHVSGVTREVDAAERIVELLTRVFDSGKLPEIEVDRSLGY